MAPHTVPAFDVLNFSGMAPNPPASVLPRARPVVDLPLDLLLARADELARAWAIALIRTRQLGRIGEIPLAQLAQQGPLLCAQALRAMQSDSELDRLTGSGDSDPPRRRSAPARSLATAAGAHDSPAAVDAVEALRGVLWEAILNELREAPARQVADIADRLGYICARALGVTIADAQTAHSDPSSSPRAVVVAVAGASGAHDLGGRDAGGRNRGALDLGGRGSGARATRPDVVIVDERAAAETPASADRARRAQDNGGGGERARQPDVERPQSWDESPPVPPARRAPEIEIRDERTGEGPAAWIGSIGNQLAQYQRDQRPFAVLLVEMREIEEIRRRESPTELARLAGLIEDALTREVRTRGSGSLTREGAGRYWLLAPDTDRPGAETLAQRARQAVAASVSYRRAPLDVVVGAAICPEDGSEAPALAAQADVELYTARSAAVRTNNARRGSLLAGLRSAREDGHS